MILKMVIAIKAISANDNIKHILIPINVTILKIIIIYYQTMIIL